MVTITVEGTASVGSRVWDDQNGNGAQDAGEPGLADVEVSLFDLQDNLVASTTTDGSGDYLFSSVPAGIEYYVVFAKPTGYIFSPQYAGDDFTLDNNPDADGLTAVFSLGLSGDSTVDAGLHHPNQAPVNTVPGTQQTSKNTHLVFSTANGNAISITDVDAGTAAVRVTLTATQGTLTLSGTTGLTFTTGDGVADATMTFTGTVANINSALNGLTFAPTTDYRGIASMQIVTNDLGNTGSGGALSDTDTVTVLVNGATVANYVWDDADHDGIQDANEAGIAGVTVNLLDEYGGWLAATTTNSSGFYQFVGLAAGNYKIQFVAPVGYQFAAKDQGSDDAIDSDADANGYTGVFSLDFNEDLWTIDAGLFYTGGNGNSGGSG